MLTIYIYLLYVKMALMKLAASYYQPGAVQELSVLLFSYLRSKEQSFPVFS